MPSAALREWQSPWLPERIPLRLDTKFQRATRYIQKNLGGPRTRQKSKVSHSDLRRAPRYRYQANLEIEWGSARLKAHTRATSAPVECSSKPKDVLWVGAGFHARLATEKPCWLECSVKRVEPGLGMGITVELREDQSQRHYRDLLAKLAAHE